MYWIVTAPVRVERQATDALIRRAFVEFLDTRRKLNWHDFDNPEGLPKKLTDGSWAKEKFILDSERWEMEPTKSTAFPFEATITIPFVRYATVYHGSKEEAAADDDFYQTYDDQRFRPEPGEVSTYDTDVRSYVIIEVIYDSSGEWREKSRKTLRDIRESQLETEEARRKAE